MKTLKNIIEEAKSNHHNKLFLTLKKENEIEEINQKIEKFNNKAQELFYKPLNEMITYYQQNENIFHNNLEYRFEPIEISIYDKKEEKVILRIEFAMFLEPFSFNNKDGYSNEGNFVYFDIYGELYNKLLDALNNNINIKKYSKINLNSQDILHEIKGIKNISSPIPNLIGMNDIGYKPNQYFDKIYSSTDEYLKDLNKTNKLFFGKDKLYLKILKTIRNILLMNINEDQLYID
jgi:hypothetical protein